MFGKPHVDDLYRLGRVTQLVTQKQAGAGGLVAANIALRPLGNFKKIIQMVTMQRFLNTPFAVRWFTEGLKAPNTRLGAEALSRASVFMIAAGEQATQDFARESGSPQPQGNREVRPAPRAQEAPPGR